MISILCCLILGFQAEVVETFMPENTVLVVSVNPQAIVDTPAFLRLKVRALALHKDLEGALAGLEKFAPLEEIREITLIVPADAQLRRNVRVLVRGNMRIPHLVKMAADKGFIPADEFENGAFMLRPGKGVSFGVGVLPDGTLVLAEPAVLKRNLKKLGLAETAPLEPVMQSALGEVRIGAALWGAGSIPKDFALLAGMAADLPIGQLDRFHFYGDVFENFDFHCYLTLRSGSDAEAFADDLRELAGLPSEKKGKASEKKKGKGQRARKKAVSKGGALSLVKDLVIKPVGGGVEVHFTFLRE